MKNRKKVWEAEQELLREQAKLNQRRNEIAKERELNRLVELSRERDKDKNIDKKSALAASGLEWMYDDQFSRDSLRDEYLLGKKKLDPVALKLSSKQDASQRIPDTTTTTTTKTTATTQIEHSSDTANSQSKRKKMYDYSKDDPMSRAQQSLKRRPPRVYSERGATATKSSMVTKPTIKGSSFNIKNSRPVSGGGKSNSKFVSMDY